MTGWALVYSCMSCAEKHQLEMIGNEPLTKNQLVHGMMLADAVKPAVSLMADLTLNEHKEMETKND